ncbi:MAG: hypothetical protein ACI8UZ_000569 [Akkermansiaceae bacterium]
MDDAWILFQTAAMPSPYQVQDLVDQNAESVVYRVLTKDGTPLSLTRLRLSPEAVESLRGPGVFDQAMGKLRSLNHGYLREVMDGGMDEVDGYPWVTSLWMDGKPLSERTVEEKEIRHLGEQFHGLLKDLGESANAVDFDPSRVLTARTTDDQLHALFSIDYVRWFRDWAAGYPPGAGRIATDEVRKLLEGLAIKQLQLPKVERPKTPIPFVEERSPALTSYQAPRERCLGRVLAWAGMLVSLAVIIWLTWKGEVREGENPRKEVPLWNGVEK